MTLCCSCSPKEPSPDSLRYPADSATIQQLTADGRLYTLQEFKDAFMTEQGNYLSDTSLYRMRGTGLVDGKYLFSLDTLPFDGPGIYIMGRVSTDDYGGNFYKSAVLQQMVGDEQQALRLSVDAGSFSGMYPRGQLLLIRCNGLAIGRYANQPQLCVPSYNNNIFADNAKEKIGWAPGRIPLARFKHATKYIGTPDASKLVYETRTIASIISSYEDLDAVRKEDGKLIRIENIHYSGQYYDDYNDCLYYCVPGDPTDTSIVNVFAPSTKNLNYPPSRLIFDANNKDYINVSMSEYAKEANYYLPGATSAEQGEVFTYNPEATPDISKPYLIANLSATLKNCIVPVDSRKQYQGWKVDDVVYVGEMPKKGYVCIGTDANGNGLFSEALGVIHCSEYVGSIQGILGYYMDNSSRKTKPTRWAISICDLSDLQLYKDGQKWVPLEYTKN